MSKREQIIDIATKLFSEKGFDKTPISEVCTLANVSKGLVFHHFKSKDELLREIYKKSTDIIIKINESKEKDLPAKAQLKDLLESFFMHLEVNKLGFQFDLNVMMQPRTKEILNDLILKRSSFIFSSAKQIFDKLDAKKSVVLTYVFIAELDGIALSFLSTREEYPLVEIKDHLLEKYMNYGN